MIQRSNLSKGSKPKTCKGASASAPDEIIYSYETLAEAIQGVLLHDQCPASLHNSLLEFTLEMIRVAGSFDLRFPDQVQAAALSRALILTHYEGKPPACI